MKEYKPPEIIISWTLDKSSYTFKDDYELKINAQFINGQKIGENKLYIKAKTGYVIIYEIQIEGKKRTQINSMTNYDYFKNEKESNIFENEAS